MISEISVAAIKSGDFNSDQTVASSLTYVCEIAGWFLFIALIASYNGSQKNISTHE